ncbi:hypothetical protein HPB48_017949 [Haemaphysalis longicornis]|uniref:Uncharacterized protein n=1 Tax=Haemaphysalis longicornis TaxID=44386 RepID=A0A9J6GLX7_HAELO|nr:hypothetical protein HPB48_017949 [Haemaphysalis longicornis]
MFALVRFLNEYAKEPYEVPVDDIKDFHPADENDFDGGKVYSAFWKDDEVPENTGQYPAQVLLLAGNCKFISVVCSICFVAFKCTFRVAL